MKKLCKCALLGLALCCAVFLPFRPAQAQDIIGHVIVGYQGWFSNPNDGSPVGALGTGGNDHLNLETYPDMSDFPASQQFPTSWGDLPDGAPAMMFSSDETFTANLHASWMKANGIDVAAIQRFGEVWPDSGNTYNSQKDQVETKMADALNSVGLKFYVEYDSSGSASGGWGSNFVSDVEADWLSNQDLDNNAPIWQRSNYAHEGGKPVVELWGMGLNANGIDATPSDWISLINWFKSQGVYVIGGVPTGWDGGPWGDALSGFTSVYQDCNAVSPWVVGRFSGTSGADSYASSTLGMNITWCQQNNVAFIPCVYPGWSFFNSDSSDTKNGIPRLAGTLMWEQFANLRNLGVGQCFVSMFDEMNEATNIMNSAANSSQIPANFWFLALNADGTSLSPDFYLRLTHDGGAMLKDQTGLVWSPPTAHWTDEPFMDVPAAVPGLVSAVNYDTGGQGLAYNATSSNGTADSYRTDGIDIEQTSDANGIPYDLGWTSAGQWFNYTVNVATAGTYTVACRVASGAAVGTTGGSFHIQNASGTNLSGSITVPGTGGWQTWTTVNATVTLSAGQQILTVSQDTGGYNFHYFSFSQTSGTAPSTPAGLSATAGNTQVSLNWSASSGATSYNVYRGTTSGGESSTPIATGLTGTSYTDNSVTNGTTYFYKVAAVNSVGTSGQSNEASATPQPTVPLAPAGLTATAGNAQVALAWVVSSGATSYNVYRGVSSGGESSTPIATGLTSNSYTNTGLTNGTTYYYKVAAVNSAGTGSTTLEVSATPSAPQTAVYQIDCGSGSAVAPFVADEFFSTGNEFSSTASINTSGVTNPAPAAVYQTVRWNSSFNYTIPGLTAGQSYTVRLHFCELTWTAAGQRVFNVAINGNSYLSNFDIFATAGGQNKALVEQTTATANSSGQIVISFTQGSADNPEIAGIEIDGSGGGVTAPSAPTNLTATAGNGQDTLNWNASSGATSYNVYRGTSSGGESSTPIATGLTGTSYTNTGLTNGTTYYYKVAAVNSAGTSGMSNEASPTPTGGAPAAPTGLTATGGNATVSLTWTGSSGATSYGVYRGTSSGGEGSSAIGTSTGVSYTDNSVTNGTLYYYTVKAVSSGGTSGASNEATATPIGGLTAVYQIDCGSPSTVSPFVADEFYSAGNEFSSTASINTSGVANAAPAAVYQTVRWNSSFNYTIPNLTAGASYTVRLHFCELTWTAAGQRVFNVAINGNSYLSSFDVFKTTGGQNKALVEQTTATANSSGQIVISFTQGSADNPEIAGIEVLH